MVRNERELARAILGKENRIELHDKLKSGVEKIKEPSSVVWVSVAAALLSSVFFWGSPSAFTLGLIVGLPAILAVCGVRNARRFRHSVRFPSADVGTYD